MHERECVGHGERGWATRETLLVMTINAREQSHPIFIPMRIVLRGGVTVAVVSEEIRKH